MPTAATTSPSAWSVPAGSRPSGQTKAAVNSARPKDYDLGTSAETGSPLPEIDWFFPVIADVSFVWRITRL
jgi:hypothetical protein